MTFSNPHKSEKLSSLLEHMAAEFIQRENPTSALITVTGSKLSDSKRNIDILISVLPETEEKKALEALGRLKKGLSQYIETHAKIGRMPSVDFKIDLGEKNRQRIEDII